WSPQAGRGGAISCRLIVRDRAGNRLILGCPNKVLTDNVPPTIGITGPTSSRDLTVDLTYAAADNENGSGLANVTLYYTTDGGATWMKYGQDNDTTSPMQFSTKLAGQIGLMLVAVDRAGNRTALPKAGEPAPFTILFDNEPPLVNFDPQLPGDGTKSAIAGNEVVDIRWKASDVNIKENSAYLEFSADGGQNWEPIPGANGLPVNGPFKWRVPQEEKNNCLLRVTVSDAMGNRGSATSLKFAIDSIRPESQIIGVEPVRDDNEGPSTSDFSKQDSNEVEAIAGPTPKARYKINDSESEDAIVEGDVHLPPIDITGTEAAGVIPIEKSDTNISKINTEPGLERGIDENTIPNFLPNGNNTGATTENTTEVARSENTEPWAGTDNGKSGFEMPDDNVSVTEPVAKASATIKEPAADIIPEATGAVATGNGQAADLIKAAEKMFADGKATQAISRCNEALALDPQSAQAYDLLARVYFSKNDFTKSAAYASRAVQLNRNEPAHWNNLGEASYNQARQLGIMLMQKTKSKVGTPEELANISQRLDDAVDRSVKSFTQVTRLSPDQKNGFIRLGDSYYLQARTNRVKKPEQSVEDYKMAIGAYSKSYNIGEVSFRETFQLGVCYYRLAELNNDDNLYARAQSFLEKSIEEADENTVPKESYWYLAEIHQKLGNTNDAITYWEQVAKSYPQNSRYRDEAKKRIKDLQDLQ
ncbi:MAG: tetratricopeptide repeat protein, partial [Planctomycetes bacterium]|nr:tetratricopeptide repeat protein [Planctomycetota bacterium]